MAALRRVPSAVMLHDLDAFFALFFFFFSDQFASDGRTMGRSAGALSLPASSNGEPEQRVGVNPATGSSSSGEA